MKAAIQVSILALALAACGTTATPPSCLGGATECDNTCVDLMADQANCGACGMACGADTVCTAGACAPVAQLCNGGAMMCGTDCVDPMVDVANCGACGMACTADQRCLSGTCSDDIWTVTESHPHDSYAAFANTIDANALLVYVLDPGAAAGTGLETYTLPTTATPTGTYAQLTAPPPADNLSYFDNPSLVGTTLYAGAGTTLYAYDTTTDTWSTAATLPDSVGSAETATDGTYVYLWAGDGYLLQFDPATTTTAHFLAPLATPSEPRVAWDSSTKQLYLGSYGGLALWSFDPTTSTFNTLGSLPAGASTSDAFCSDNHGHIFTTNTSCSADMVVWMYSAGADAWTSFPALPNDHGCQTSCTTTADGWLFLESNQVTVAAVSSDVLDQYRLFVPEAGGSN